MIAVSMSIDDEWQITDSNMAALTSFSLYFSLQNIYIRNVLVITRTKD